MPRIAKSANMVDVPIEPPAKNPESREEQLIALAMQRAEEKLRDGTASPQIIVHFLKLGSTRERIEKEILAEQKGLYAAKTKAYEEAKDIKKLYADAIDAIRAYSGNAEVDDDDYPD